MHGKDELAVQHIACGELEGEMSDYLCSEDEVQLTVHALDGLVAIQWVDTLAIRSELVVHQTTVCANYCHSS